MDGYQFPDLNNRRVIFKGRRYLVFEVSPDHPFEVFGDDENFVVWDGVNGGSVAAIGTTNADGTFSGELAFSHVTIEVDDAESISDFVKHVRRTQDRYYRECGV